jgi:hypothetical protein
MVKEEDGTAVLLHRSVRAGSADTPISLPSSYRLRSASHMQRNAVYLPNPYSWNGSRSPILPPWHVVS